MLKGAERHGDPARRGAQASGAGADAGLKLGLIGDNIAQSKAPVLHSMAGKIAGLAVSYERLVPCDLGTEFDETFDRCAAGGYRGVNVTYPYKERAAARVQIEDPLVRAVGAVNTVLFEPSGPRGFNTDYSGFIAAYRGARGKSPAGTVCMIGAGGVGKAVAFGLLKLGLAALWIIDRDRLKAVDLAARLAAVAPEVSVTLSDGLGDLPTEFDGLINCTPVGMVGYEGTPLPREHMRGCTWVFDAVYTPPDTQFLQDAKSEGLTIISGYELFIHQGVDAWGLFAGRPVGEAQLRQLLIEAGAGPED